MCFYVCSYRVVYWILWWLRVHQKTHKKSLKNRVFAILAIESSVAWELSRLRVLRKYA